GPSGCGKTTLLRIIGGLIAKSAGSGGVDGGGDTQPPGGHGFVFLSPRLSARRKVFGKIFFSVGVPRKKHTPARRPPPQPFGAGGAERLPCGAAAPALRRQAPARGTLSRARSPAEALAHGRAFRRARRAHQNGHERSAASHPPRNQGVGFVRDPFHFRSRLSLG